jgi:hypothetical protein
VGYVQGRSAGSILRWVATFALAAWTACDVTAPAASVRPPALIAPDLAAAPSPAPAATVENPLASVASAPGPSSASSAAPALPPPRRPGAYANVDPSDDDVPGAPDVVADCDDQLTRAGVKFRHSTLPVHTEHKLVCGAPQVVIYQRGPGKIVYDPAPLLTCPMALALASLERIVQEEAARVYGSAVVRIDQLGTYSCREMAAYPGWVSEHAYANAIDLARFTLKTGVTVDVERDFDKGEATPARRAGAFLRSVSQRAFDEDVFSHVLTPFFDANHRNHFHVDLARYRGDGTRPNGA